MTRGEAIERMVAEEAGLEMEEAGQAIDAFVRCLAWFVPAEAADLVASVAGRSRSPSGEREADGDSVRDFLLAFAEQEEVEAGRAALHARVVAESIRRTLPESEAVRLREALGDDDFAALFETDGRGELTEPSGTTEGVERLAEDGDSS